MTAVLRWLAVLLAAPLIISCATEPLMASNPPPPALYRVADAGADGACVRATLEPAHGGARVTHRFCDGFSMTSLRRAAPGHWLVAVQPAAADTRVLPVTVAMTVSPWRREADGSVQVMASPRPSPITVPAAATTILATVAQAERQHQPVVFALSDPFTASDAAIVDEATALNMLGAVKTGQ